MEAMMLVVQINECSVQMLVGGKTEKEKKNLLSVIVTIKKHFVFILQLWETILMHLW